MAEYAFKNKTAKEIALAYNQVFMSPSGRLVLRHLMAVNHFVDPCQDLVHEGQRRAVLGIFEQINTARLHGNAPTIDELEDVLVHDVPLD